MKPTTISTRQLSIYSLQNILLKSEQLVKVMVYIFVCTSSIYKPDGNCRQHVYTILQSEMYIHKPQHHICKHIFCTKVSEWVEVLPRDATQSAVMPQYVICLSVRPSVMFRYHDHTGWNSSKIISWLISLRLLLGLTPTWAIWCNWNTPKIRVE